MTGNTARRSRAATATTSYSCACGRCRSARRRLRCRSGHRRTRPDHHEIGPSPLAGTSASSVIQTAHVGVPMARWHGLQRTRLTTRGQYARECLASPLLHQTRSWLAPPGPGPRTRMLLAGAGSPGGVTHISRCGRSGASTPVWRLRCFAGSSAPWVTTTGWCRQRSSKPWRSAAAAPLVSPTTVRRPQTPSGDGLAPRRFVSYPCLFRTPPSSAFGSDGAPPP